MFDTEAGSYYPAAGYSPLVDNSACRTHGSLDSRVYARPNLESARLLSADPGACEDACEWRMESRILLMCLESNLRPFDAEMEMTAAELARERSAEAIAAAEAPLCRRSHCTFRELTKELRHAALSRWPRMKETGSR